jgi:hypothetical protein
MSGPLLSWNVAGCGIALSFAFAAQFRQFLPQRSHLYQQVADVRADQYFS